MSSRCLFKGAEQINIKLWDFFVSLDFCWLFQELETYEVLRFFKLQVLSFRIIIVQIRKLRAEREMPELVFKAFNCLTLFWTGSRLPLYWTGRGQKSPPMLTTMKLGRNTV